MKIKEVCKRTNLTERTVRFYVEEKLINPETSLKNNREYRDYSEPDVTELETIADLRKLFFSINEIKEMKESPTRIAEIVAEYKKYMNADAKAKATIVETLDTINLSSVSNIESLALSLKRISENLQLPKRDVNPDFGRFDQESRADKEREYQLYEERMERQYLIGKVIVFTIATLHIISNIVSAFIDFSFFSFVIQMALGVALFMGVTWVRYLFVIGAGLSVLLGFSMLTGGHISDMEPGLVWLIVVQTLYAVAASVFLLVHSGVKEFLYSQKNG